MKKLSSFKFFADVRKKTSSFTASIHYFLASFKRKYHCRILDIYIPEKGDNIVIKFSLTFKQNLFQMSPLDILEKDSILSLFSPNDAAMIGLLSSIDLGDEKCQRDMQINKIYSLFPKLEDHLHYEFRKR